jgi:uncharacterized membrane protein YphA (DoxX/SURF4 family)
VLIPCCYGVDDLTRRSNRCSSRPGICKGLQKNHSIWGCGPWAIEASLIAGTHGVPGEADRLQKFFSTFPDGWPGLGLGLLRLTVGLSVVIQGAGMLIAPHGPTVGSWAMGLGVMLVGAALLIGFLTPLAGASAAIGNSVVGFSLLAGSTAMLHERVLPAIQLAVMSVALVMLGPGAFSLDAHLFGRREITIPRGRTVNRR